MKPFPKPNIVDVFEHYGLRVIGADRGGWRKAECPLPDHEDRNPSASINEDGCRWHCHSCNQGGDAVDVIEARDDAGRAAAIKVAEGFLGAGDGDVREERGLAGILPRSSGNRAGRGAWRAPWSRL